MKQPLGFTFLEVMIAVAILALVLVVTFQNQAQSISMSEESRYLTHAAFLAREKMAALESREAPAGVSETGTWEDPFGDFKWEVTVEDTEIDQVKKMTVIVELTVGSFAPFVLEGYRYEGS